MTSVTSIGYTYTVESLAGIEADRYDDALYDALVDSYPEADVSIHRGSYSRVLADGSGGDVESDVRQIANAVYDELCAVGEAD